MNTTTNAQLQSLDMPLSRKLAEDLVLVQPEEFMTAQSREAFRTKYSEYLRQEGFTSCKIGFPYMILGKRNEMGDWLQPFLEAFPCPASVFYYFDLASEIRPGKWSTIFPEILSMPNLYVRCSKSTDWNDFLTSIWDFNKANVHVHLLNTNAVMHHQKYQKIIQSLLFRGVTLGFHGSFNLKWYQNRSRFLRSFANWGVVDFWHTKSFDLNTKEYLYEKENKLKYFDFKV